MADHAFGQSCGGLTTKIHLAADNRCRPRAFPLTPVQAALTDVLSRCPDAPVPVTPAR